MFRKLSALLWLSFIFTQVSAQTGRELAGYYSSPLDLKLMLSANFAETRPNHFHSGIDIRTEGVEGKPLYAAADGYIARIGIAPTGFGRVLYIAHPNGTTTVYAHMQKFTPDVEKYVDEERHRQKRHRVDLNPPAGRFPVKKGEFIGNAGNSGSSAGPHLHFEVRETASQRPLNVMKRGIFNVRDDIPPTIVNMYYIRTDTLQGVPVHSAPRRLPVNKVSESLFALADTSAVVLGPNGYFVLEVTDRKNDSPNNTMGVYRVEAELDGDLIFGFSLDSFLFNETRYVNSMCQFDMQRGQRNQFIRLALQQNNKLPAYEKFPGRGAVNLRDDVRHVYTVRVHDDNGNVSRITFPLRRRSGTAETAEILAPDGIKVSPGQSFTHNITGMSVTIPAGALYEPIFFRYSVDNHSRAGHPASVKRYSPVYTVHDRDIPLHSSMTLSIRPDDVPERLRSKLCMAVISADGTTYSYAGGKLSGGRITANINYFGRFCVVADTVPPTVTSSFSDGADLTGRSSVSFTVKDDFSGIASYTATIDGQWIPFEETVSQGRITHNFNDDRITYGGGRTHKLVLTVTDNKGNSTTLQRSFVR